jgi:hypothetical protein
MTSATIPPPSWNRCARRSICLIRRKCCPGPKGGHKDDGVWAEVWYGAVWTSTGFAGPEGDLPEVPEHLQPVLDAAMPYYEQLKAAKI